MKYILFFPGYIILTLMYFFPNEGMSKDRNVATSGRQWRKKDTFAVYYTVMCYLTIALFQYGNS